MEGIYLLPIVNCDTCTCGKNNFEIEVEIIEVVFIKLLCM